MLITTAIALYGLLIFIPAVLTMPHSLHNAGSKQAKLSKCPSLLKLKINIEQGGQLIIINLIESSREFLLSSERSSIKGGTQMSCFYQGSVENDEGFAIAKQMDRQLSGTFYYRNQVYEIPDQLATLHYQPLVARLMQARQGKRTCGVRSASIARETAGTDGHNRKQASSKPKLERGRQIIKLDTNSDFPEASRKYIKLILIGDQYFYNNQSKDEAKARSRLWEVANYVNALYKMLGVIVITVHTEIWTTDPYTLTSAANAKGVNSNELLELFMKYRMAKLNSKTHSAAHLISSLKFSGTDVGLANTDRLCSFALGGGVNSDQEADAYGVAATVAHELGHNVGLAHDEEEKNCPTCPDSQGCVMAEIGSAVNPVRFSQCSLKRFLDKASKGIGYCMTDPPEDSDVVATEASCGNKIIEAGEQCDCGPDKWCNNKCCDPNTCKFTSGASCASGECCDLSTCALKSKGTLCRAVKTVCDLPESCDGTSEWCPRVDDYKVDGTECMPGKAYCYKGRCDDRDTRCKALYDGADVKAAPADWSVATTKGVNYGYCSYNVTMIDPLTYSYTACKPENQLCGLLYCVGSNVVARDAKWIGDVDAVTFVETIGRVAITGAGGALIDLKYSGYRDPGLVPNGAECGIGKMCVDSGCVSTAPKVTCPSCNGHGACTQSGLCFCDAGYAPPDCLKPGLGGSSTDQSTDGIKTDGTEPDGAKPDRTKPDRTKPDLNGPSSKQGSKSAFRSAISTGWGDSLLQVLLLNIAIWMLLSMQL